MVVLIAVMVKKRRINLFVVKIIELSLQMMHFIDRAGMSCVLKHDRGE